jgi:hypothetical protein
VQEWRSTAMRGKSLFRFSPIIHGRFDGERMPFRANRSRDEERSRIRSKSIGARVLFRARRLTAPFRESRVWKLKNTRSRRFPKSQDLTSIIGRRIGNLSKPVLNVQWRWRDFGPGHWSHGAFSATTWTETAPSTYGCDGKKSSSCSAV